MTDRSVAGDGTSFDHDAAWDLRLVLVREWLDAGYGVPIVCWRRYVGMNVISI